MDGWTNRWIDGWNFTLNNKNNMVVCKAFSIQNYVKCHTGTQMNPRIFSSEGNGSARTRYFRKACYFSWLWKENWTPWFLPFNIFQQKHKILTENGSCHQFGLKIQFWGSAGFAVFCVFKTLVFERTAFLTTIFTSVKTTTSRHAGRAIAAVSLL